MNIRHHFPLLDSSIRTGSIEFPLIYFDNSATTQKPRSVAERISRFYSFENSNVHRSIHSLGENATAMYEGVRKCVANFLQTQDESEIVFTSGTTEAINLVARSWGSVHLKKGDGILLTEMEHHSNLIPWQMLAAETGAVLHHIPVTDDGELDLQNLDRLLAKNIKLTALCWVSNVLGTVNPVREIGQRAHLAGSLVLVDGAQGVAHLESNIPEMDCDFFAFSAHKMFGPTGCGVLWARGRLLESMSPYKGGGDMVNSVWLDRYEAQEHPWKFEAGTPNIAGVLGLQTAIEFIRTIGIETIANIEKNLASHLQKQLSGVPGLRRFGVQKDKIPVESFTVEGIHPHDMAAMLDSYGVAVRAGHHCAHPLMRRFGINATLRASLCAYNSIEEIDRFTELLSKAISFFKQQ